MKHMKEALRKSKKRKKIGTVLVLIGMLTAAYPFISGLSVHIQNEEALARVEAIAARTEGTKDSVCGNETAAPSIVTPGTGNKEAAAAADFEGLYADLQAYNRSLAENGQDFTDQWAHPEFEIPLPSYGLKDSLFGYIDIPAIQLKLPLYLGSEEKNLRNGAAVIRETSAPIGGMGTNAVIAAHNGWNGTKRFIKCEALRENDRIYITNFYETLCYEVTDHYITTAQDDSAMRIDKKADCITLITCYPYTGRQTEERLVVRAQRETGSLP